MLIDISHYQGNVPPSAFADAEGFYIKTTEGASATDPNWSTYYDQCVAAGKPRGAYHFADLRNPVDEANHFADVCLRRSWQLRPTLDIELTGSTASWLASFRSTWRARAHAAGIPNPDRFRVYSSYALLTGSLPPSPWVDSWTDIWAARYNTILGWTHPQLVLWQNSSAAQEPGFLGSVDTDQYMNGWAPYRDLAEIAAPRGSSMSGINTDFYVDYERGRAGFSYETVASGSVTGIQHVWACITACWGSISGIRMVTCDGVGKVVKEEDNLTFTVNQQFVRQLADNGRLVTFEWDPAQTWDATADRSKGAKLWGYPAFQTA